MKKLSLEDQQELLRLLEWRIAWESENARKLPGVTEFKTTVEQYQRILAILQETFEEENKQEKD